MRFSLIFLLICGFWALAIGQDTQDKIEPLLLEQYAESNLQPVVIQLMGKADLRQSALLSNKAAKGRYVFETLQDFAKKDQQAVSAYLEAKGKSYRSFYIVNAVYAQLSMSEVEELATMPSVKRLTSNPVTSSSQPKRSVEEATERTELPWGILMINADDAWAMGYTGQGVVVGGQDTGYKWDHVSLKEKYRGWENGSVDHNYNWHDAIHEISPIHEEVNPTPDLNPCGLDSTVPCDDIGHGTLTMGAIVGGEGDNQIGIAPEAKWIGVRNMERGYGSSITYLEGLQWFLAPTNLANETPDPSKAPHVINNSWTCPGFEGCNLSNFDLMKEAIDNLKAAGIVVVASAGNSGPDCSTLNAPAAIFDNAFSVGATLESDDIAEFSSRGPVLIDGSNRMKPNISAPGKNIKSAAYEGGYGIYEGTSLAGPYVAGVVALMISANPSLAGHVEDIESIIESTADPKITNENCGGFLGTEVPNPTFGHGRINALAAVQEALLFTNTTAPQVAHEALQIIPNPAEERVSITSATGFQQACLAIYDQAGRQVRMISPLNEGIELSLQDLAAGVYLIEVLQVDKVFKGKLVKI